MHEVHIVARDLAQFAALTGAERAESVAASAARAQRLLHGRSVVNVSSTAAGGGVAEMLHVLLAYVRGAGIDARWAVIEAAAPFFTLTKRLHNHLYGGVGDGGALGEPEHRLYGESLRAERPELAAMTRRGDVVVLHDPQTAGLAEFAASLGCRVVWRCHVGVDHPNDNSRRGWEFLRRYLEPFVDHYVFTNERFAPPWAPPERRSVIWPSIDPFSPKNQELDPARVRAILSHVGILAGSDAERDTSFVRSDGSPGRVERYCDVFRTGPPADPDTPLVVQVSRWDRMKDMCGVMEAFAAHVDSGRTAELVLAGPVVSAVADDPEGGEVLQQCWAAWRQLPHAVRRRVQLVCLPMHDLEENAAITNALQRHAAVVTQKSLAEGFGLTVAEAMLKGRPVVATAVGGLADQVVHGETGLLVDDPHDLATFGAAVRGLLDDEELRARLGRNARRRAVELHIGDTHLERWVEVVARLLDGP
ncbi:MAG: glycosyltransferase [Acidimicrobiales bacterium]